MALNALSVSNVKDRDLQTFFAGAGKHRGNTNPAWQEMYDWSYQGNVNQIQVGAMSGVGNFGSWDGESTISPSTIQAMNAKSMSYGVFAASVAVNSYTAEEVPNYRELILDRLGFCAAGTIAKAAGIALAAAFTSNTGNHAVHGSKPLIATDHEMEGGTRSNKISAIYDRSAYLAARNGIVTWEDYQGVINDLGGAGLNVAFHTHNREAVLQSFGSSVTSSQNQLNVAGLDNVNLVECPYLADEDDVLVSTRIDGAKPFKAWERKAPELRIFNDATKGGLEVITCHLAYGFGNAGVPDGVFGITAD